MVSIMKNLLSYFPSLPLIILTMFEKLKPLQKMILLPHMVQNKQNFERMESLKEDESVLQYISDLKAGAVLNAETNALELIDTSCQKLNSPIVFNRDMTHSKFGLKINILIEPYKRIIDLTKDKKIEWVKK